MGNKVGGCTGSTHSRFGDKTKARSACQDFLALWKQADPDIPIFQQAKSEYTKTAITALRLPLVACA